MARSLKKGFYVNPRVVKKLKKMKEGDGKKILKIWDRACQISPDMIGHTFAVHNGKQFVSVYVSESMVGHRFGEFAFTRTFRGHPF